MAALSILGVTINEVLQASNYVENLLSVWSRSLFTLRVLSAHGLLDVALHTVTRATTIARLMYAVSACWDLTSESDRASVERLYQQLQRMGYLPRDAPRTLALVEQAGHLPPGVQGVLTLPLF